MAEDQRLRQIFGACDQGDKGYITKDEWMAFTSQLPEEQAAAVFAQLDSDNDGVVYFPEFAQGCAFLFSDPSASSSPSSSSPTEHMEEHEHHKLEQQHHQQQQQSSQNTVVVDREELENLKEIMINLERAREEAIQDKESLLMKLQMMESQIIEAETINSKMMEEIRSLQETLSTERKDKKNAQGLKKQLSEIREELDETKQALEEVRKNEKKLIDIRIKLSEDKNTALRQIAEHKERLLEQSEQIVDLQKQVKSSNNLSAQITTLEQQLRKALDENALLSEEMHTKQHLIDTSNELKAQYADLTKMFEQQKQMLDFSQRWVDELTGKLEEARHELEHAHERDQDASEIEELVALQQKKEENDRQRELMEQKEEEMTTKILEITASFKERIAEINQEHKQQIEKLQKLHADQQGKVDLEKQQQHEALRKQQEEKIQLLTAQIELTIAEHKKESEAKEAQFSERMREQEQVFEQKIQQLHESAKELKTDLENQIQLVKKENEEQVAKLLQQINTSKVEEQQLRHTIEEQLLELENARQSAKQREEENLQKLQQLQDTLRQTVEQHQQLMTDVLEQEKQRTKHLLSQVEAQYKQQIDLAHEDVVHKQLEIEQERERDIQRRIDTSVRSTIDQKNLETQQLLDSLRSDLQAGYLVNEQQLRQQIFDLEHSLQTEKLKAENEISERDQLILSKTNSFEADRLKLETEITSLREQRAADAQNLVSVQQEVLDLKKQLDDSNVAASALQTSHDRLAEQVSALTSQNKSLSENSDSLATELRTQLQTLENEKVLLAETIDNLTRRVSDLEVQKVEQTQQLAQRESKIQLLESQVSSLTEDVQRGTQKYETEMQRVAKESNQLQDKIDEISRGSQSTREKDQVELDNLHKQLKDSVDLSASQQSTVSQQQEEIVTLKKAILELQNDHASQMQSTRIQLGEVNESLENEKSQRTIDKMRLENQIEQLTQSHQQELENERLQHEQDVQQLRSQMEAQTVSHRAKINDEQKELARVQEQLIAKESVVQELEMEKKSMELRHESESREWVSSRQSLELERNRYKDGYNNMFQKTKQVYEEAKHWRDQAKLFENQAKALQQQLHHQQQQQIQQQRAQVQPQPQPQPQPPVQAPRPAPIVEEAPTGPRSAMQRIFDSHRKLMNQDRKSELEKLVIRDADKPITSLQEQFMRKLRANANTFLDKKLEDAKLTLPSSSSSPSSAPPMSPVAASPVGQQPPRLYAAPSPTPLQFGAFQAGTAQRSATSPAFYQHPK